MSNHAPFLRQNAPPPSENRSPALIFSPQGNIWSSSTPPQQGWPDSADRWSAHRPAPRRDPLQPSHNIHSARNEKDPGPVARGDLLQEYQRVKEEKAEQSRRPRVGAIGEGRFGGSKSSPSQVRFRHLFSPLLRVIRYCPCDRQLLSEPTDQLSLASSSLPNRECFPRLPTYSFLPSRHRRMASAPTMPSPMIERGRITSVD